MPSPWKHPATGVYYVRVKVPEALQAKVGYETHQRSLGTKVFAEAKVLFPRALADLHQRWADIAVERPAMSAKDRWALAGEYCQWSVARNEANPGRPEDWKRSIERDEACLKPAGGRMPSPTFPVHATLPIFLAERGIVIDDREIYALATDCSKAEVIAKKVLLRYAQGDYRKPPELEAFPEYVPPRPAAGAPPATENHLSVGEHWDVFVAQKEFSLGTQKSWKPVLLKFEKHLGRSNLATATAREIGDWKDALMATALSKKTVKDTYLSAVRTFLEWGVEGGKLDANPSANIKVPRSKVVESEPTEGERDLSDEHAHLILSEALRPSDDRTHPLFARAKRWVPWICAYTGARVNEVTQVRKMDFRRERVDDVDVWIMRITPDAGTVKGGKARDVVLHPHLAEQGLFDFVQAQPEGPLFYDPERSRGGSKFNQPFRKVGEKLARWVREIGMDDPKVDPNHGWRHRFKSTAEGARMLHRVKEGMAGHATATVGEKYGKIPLPIKWEEVCKLPRYQVSPPTGALPDTVVRRKRNVARVATAERAKTRPVLRRKPLGDRPAAGGVGG